MSSVFSLIVIIDVDDDDEEMALVKASSSPLVNSIRFHATDSVFQF